MKKYGKSNDFLGVFRLDWKLQDDVFQITDMNTLKDETFGVVRYR